MPAAQPSRPRSGRPTASPTSSRSQRPVMRLLELLGRRWALRVLWELRDQRHRFRSLQEACGGISPAVLNDRLRELRDGRLVELHEGEGYGLSPLGHELLERFGPMVGWADRWARSLPRQDERRRSR